MIIDSHCHVYPDHVASKAAHGISAFYDGIPPYMDGRIETLLEDERKNHVDHAVIFSVATTLKQVSSINHFISETVENSKGCFTGLGAYHPECVDASSVLDEIEALGLRGIKTHPDFQKTAVDDPLWFPLYEEAGRRGLPVLIHCGDYRYDYSNPKR
ncbi:MAG: amidohydrolase family protein, partial [Spirochaetales bacterium]|nr:amidohydrolase family protein [Candidatus Physcosoma equi]